VSADGPGNPEQLRDQVAARLGATEDPRLRTLVETAVRHLHAFVTETGLAPQEWEAGIAFLTAVGQMCTPTRQEFILLSDTLGVSSLVESMAGGSDASVTEATVVGPFYVPGSPVRAFGASIVEDPDPGPRVTVGGRVIDAGGRPIPGALLDVWQNATNRLYAVQDPEQSPTNLRGRLYADDEGRYQFETVRPVPYQIPADGPVGQMLAATGRHPWRPAHIHIRASAPGFSTLTTHVFDADSPYLDSDVVFGVRDSLVVPFTPDGPDRYATRFDLVLAPEAEPATGARA
jgi:catechol 1,2-dioxygenase